MRRSAVGVRRGRHWVSCRGGEYQQGRENRGAPVHPAKRSPAPFVLIVFFAVVSLAVVFAAGCGQGPAAPEGAATTSDETVTSATAADPPTTQPPETSSPPSTLVENGYRATTVVEGLRVPWEMRFLPDGRLLVTEREGRLVIADVAGGAVSEVGTIDVVAQGESGLMGLALDPGFPENPSIYVCYTYAAEDGIRNRVSRLELTGLDGASPQLGEEMVLVDDIPAASIHDGSRVAFGPDGYLWVTMGDANDPDSAQREDSLSGKVLRMTREGQPAPDDLFPGLSYPFSLIYTLGHRNPQGLAFHPQTGQAYVTEHGPGDNDEVNRLEAGANYGWPEVRGEEGRSGFTDPLIAWTPTIAPAGCLFYSGGTLPDLEGTFLFVTLKERDLRVLVPSRTAGGDGAGFTTVADEMILFDERFGRLRAIAQGPDGALYIATSNHDGRGDPGSLDDRVIRIDPVE